MLTFCTQREPNTHTWTWKYRAPTIGAPHLKICILLSLLCTATPTLAANWIVDSNGLGNFATIQAAIDAAADGDRIEVNWGHYQGNGASVINTQGKGLTLDAPFGASVWGAGQQTCIVCDSQEMADTIISGFIFHAGDGGNDRGGGIHLDGSSPTFIDCDIRECEADLGGGLRASNSNASFTNCTFENNTATRGGGLHLTQFTDNCPQHVGTALTMNTRASDDLAFHGGVSGSIHHPANDYQAADGRVFATFLNAGVSLVDVPPGTGFVCIPGSHKSHFPKPEHVGIYDGPPTVDNVSVEAGDVVLFTEALCHGARKWTQDEPRRTVFVRYTTSYASWSPGSGPLEEFRDRISADLFELKQVASFRHRKKMVERLLREISP